MPLTLLLNWRTWAALAVALALSVALVFSYKKGAESVQVDFDVYKNQQILSTLNAEESARAKEHTLQTANEKVSQNYEDLKTATATVVGALDADRMRLQATIRTASGASKDPGTNAGIDANPKDRVLEESIDGYASVAGDADKLSDQVTGLQKYVSEVCHGNN